MSYSDPPRRERPPRYQAFAQYGDSFPSGQDNQHQSYQDTQVDFGTGREHAAWDGARRDAPPWGELPTRAAGGLRAVPDTTRQTGGIPRQTGGFSRDASGFNRDTGEMPRQSGGMRLFDDLDEQDGRRGRGSRGGSGRGQAGSRGMVGGAIAGFVAAGLAIGMGNLAAAFVRPQASPIIAVGETFINHTPSALKNFAVEKFGENDKTMLLVGMYVTIALLAIFIGIMAWRRMALGVAGIGLFGLFGAYTAITLPASHVTDVIPSIIAGIVGIAAIVFLVRIGTTSTQKRPSSAWAGGRS